MSIVIVDYGIGNLKSLHKALNHVTREKVIISSNYQIIKQASRLILPGVGAFKEGIDNIIKNEIGYQLINFRNTGKPILGVCLGMQLLTDGSEEGGSSVGLGFYPGRLTRFLDADIRVPHVGFNQVDMNDQESKYFKGMNNLADFYFTHSFRLKLEEKRLGVIGTTYYGEEFISFYEKENVAGAQFHPELSQSNGVKFLENFVGL